MELILIAALIGLASAIGIYGIHRAFLQIPFDDRRYRDRPPLLFHVLWPLIRLCTHYGSGLLRLFGTKRIIRMMRKSGVDYAIDPYEFVAAKVVMALIVTMGTLLLIQGALAHHSLLFLSIALMGGFLYPEYWLKKAGDRRSRAIAKSLPFFLDVLTLSVEAGLSFGAALAQAVEKAPDGPLKQEFKRILRDVRAGKPRSEAMRDFADRVDLISVNGFVSAVIQAETLGVSLGQTLRMQAEQRRNERFLRAEKLAMEAPVKMLGPLILFIFPCTFIVLLFPIAMKFMQSGIVGGH